MNPLRVPSEAIGMDPNWKYANKTGNPVFKDYPASGGKSFFIYKLINSCKACKSPILEIFLVLIGNSI